MKMSTGALGFLLFIILLSLVACSEIDNAAENAGSDVKSINIINLFPLSQKHFNDGELLTSILFDSLLFQDGWIFGLEKESQADKSDAETTENVSKENTLCIAAKDNCVFRFHVYDPSDRIISYDIRKHDKYPASQSLKLTVSVNGFDIESYAVQSDRYERKEHFIPAEYLSTGLNRIEFNFSNAIINKPFMRARRRVQVFEHAIPKISAHFNHFKISPAIEAEANQIAWLGRADTFKYRKDPSALKQFANSAFDVAIESTEFISLELAGLIEQADRSTGSVRIIVSARTDSQDWHPIYTYTYSEKPEASQFEAEVPLSDFNKENVAFRFAVDDSQAVSSTFVTWSRINLITGGGSQSDAVADKPKSFVKEKTSFRKRVKHVVICIFDSSRADFYGSYGFDQDTTPNIDAFAKQSIQFNQAISSAPYTITSISTMMSSLMPEAHGVRKEWQDYPEDLHSMVKTFGENGYWTLVISGLPFINTKYHLTNGADHYEEELIQRRFKQLGREQAFEKAEQAIDTGKQSGKPLFIYAHMLPPHSPYNPPKQFKYAFKPDAKTDVLHWFRDKKLLDLGILGKDSPDLDDYRSYYMGNMLFSDYLFSDFMDMLKRKGIYEEALIILTSDHGEGFGEHGEYEHGTSVFDEMIHVPMFVHYPGVNADIIENQVGLIDIFPTMIDLFDLKSDSFDPSDLQGESIAALMLGFDQPDRRYIYSRAGRKDIQIFSLRSSTLKFVNHVFEEYLFNIEDDPHEKNNLIDKFLVTAMLMKQKALALQLNNFSINKHILKDAELDQDTIESLKDLGYLQ